MLSTGLPFLLETATSATPLMYLPANSAAPRALDPSLWFGRYGEMEQLSRPTSFLDGPQAARASLRWGECFPAEMEVRTAPTGLLAIGALVAAILLSIPPIIRAGAEAVEARRSRSKGRS